MQREASDDDEAEKATEAERYRALAQSIICSARSLLLVDWRGRFLRRSEIAAFFTRPTRYGCFLVALMLLVFLAMVAIVIAISTFQMFGLSWWFLGTLGLVLGLIGLVVIISRQLGRISRNHVPQKHRKKNRQ